MKCGVMTDARPLARPDGQVWIYQGVLAAHRVRPLPEAAVATVREHLEHESAHLAAWNDVLDEFSRNPPAAQAVQRGL